MKKKVIWLMVACLMTLALVAVSCYSAPASPTTPVAPTTPTAPTAPATPPTTPAVPATPAAPGVKEPTPVGIQISGSAFVPATITIAVGTTVTWTNKDSLPHTVSSQGTLFDSGSLSRGATFSYTFNQKGTFEYTCGIHPAMVGKVIVE